MKKAKLVQRSIHGIAVTLVSAGRVAVVLEEAYRKATSPLDGCIELHDGAMLQHMRKSHADVGPGLCTDEIRRGPAHVRTTAHCKSEGGDFHILEDYVRTCRDG
mmetsp:Transcript_74745/g.150381  ORF Transcript_74745/g.150381 Transcript_74745/m.150381 type:complete len:104 (-) Transcript_74745:477-788(-)